MPHWKRVSEPVESSSLLESVTNSDNHENAGTVEKLQKLLLSFGVGGECVLTHPGNDNGVTKSFFAENIHHTIRKPG